MKFLAKNIGATLHKALKESKEVKGAVAFFSPNNETQKLLKGLGKLELVISDDFVVNNPHNLQKLDVKNNIKVISAIPNKLHSKVLIGTKKDGSKWALLGSSNLTHRGLFQNHEANIFLDEKDDFKLINELEKYAGGLFKIAKNPDWETAKEEYKKHKESTNIVTDEPNYWILKINHGNSKDNEWENVKKGVLAIGWGNTLDPTKVSLEELKKDLHEVHKNDKKYTVNKLNGWAKTILTFAKEIKINDKVIICDGYNETGEEVHVFGVAKVTGNYLFDVKSTWVWKNKIGADIKSIDKKIKIDILRKLFNMGTLMGTLHGTLKGKKIDKSLFDNFSKMIKKETGESIEF